MAIAVPSRLVTAVAVHVVAAAAAVAACTMCCAVHATTAISLPLCPADGAVWQVSLGVAAGTDAHY
jgi:hypothetical protein